MSIEELAQFLAPITGIGFLIGVVPMLMGIGFRSIINIFKKI